MQNFNTSKYINVIGVRPHMIVKGHTDQGFAIYYHDNQYVIFNISCGNRLKIETCKSLRVAKKYIQRNGVNIPNRTYIEFTPNINCLGTTASGTVHAFSQVFVVQFTF